MKPMKTFGLLCFLLVFAQWSYGQEFDFQFSHALPDTATFYALEWADADNDGSLEVFAFGKNTADENFCLLFMYDRLQGLEVAGQIKTAVKDASWLITDIDGDNSVDIIMSGVSDAGPVTYQFLNEGGFVFMGTKLFDRYASALAMVDLDQDGMREMLISGHTSGTPFLNILNWQSSGWTIVHDSITVAATALEFFDFDADSDMDFFIAGINESNERVARTYYNQRGFYFTADDIVPVSGSSVKADLNHDGYFDMFLAGEDDDGRHRLVRLLNDGNGDFLSQDTLRTASHAKLLAADLTSDGLADLNVFGYEEHIDTVNFIQSSAEVSLPHKHLVSQSWGDLDRDGDLDLLQLIRTSQGNSLQLFQNTTLPANAAPLAPSDLVVAEIMNRLFVCWKKPTDDRTPQNSLTYDVAIQAAGSGVVSADFDVLNGRRLTVSHGNNGTADYMLVRDVGTADVGVNIQAVDNSFHAGPGSICRGSGGDGRGLCSEVETLNLALCKNEIVTLSGSSNTRWFSFERGFLADTSVLVLHFQQPDTVFSLTRNPDCARIAVYVLASGQNLTRVSQLDEQLCEGEVVRLGVEPDWESVAWSSVSSGVLSGEDTIAYTAIGMDTVSVMLSDGSGCVLQRNIAVSVTKPVISGDDTYQIMKGESVRLNVSGGTSYEWDPPSGLDNATLPNPLASPLKTTEYIVTASDSLGCQSWMRILVIVEQTAFVPNLFTPNRDGKNDVLKIYGLGRATDFSFTIYNREGVSVYHAQDVSSVTTEGWNGTAGGVDQPGGVYYWSVRGQTAEGKELKLNGRSSGSIVLLR